MEIQVYPLLGSSTLYNTVKFGEPDTIDINIQQVILIEQYSFNGQRTFTIPGLEAQSEVYKLFIGPNQLKYITEKTKKSIVQTMSAQG